MSRSFNVCVVGPRTLVGEALLEILEERSFPVADIFVLDTGEEVAETAAFAGRDLAVRDIASFDFSTVQLAFFCGGADLSREYAQTAADVGCVVIDDSDAFRMQEEVPLIVPEVNGGLLAELRHVGLIASPNSCATILATVLKPIQERVGVARVNVVTLQSVSGLGRAAVEELARQSMDLFNQNPLASEVFPKQIAFNLLPHIGTTEPDGYTREEAKIMAETRRLLRLPELAIAATAIRAPVFYGHAMTIQVETQAPLDADEARALFEAAPGLTVYDDASATGYPTPVVEAASNDPIFVGRIRNDPSCTKGLALWAVADNMRKGSALNCVQVAELLVKNWQDSPIM
jgi:aspartate-semialdehyde dehydrogenase